MGLLDNMSMAIKKPIEILKLNKTGILAPDRFYRLLSEQCDYIDPESAKSFYIGLVRLLTKELRENGVVRMPYIGDIALVKQRSKWGWVGSTMAYVTGLYALKFYPNKSWREYFYNLSKRPGKEGALDPREKILNMDLSNLK